MDYLSQGRILFQQNPKNHILNTVINGKKIWFKRATPPKAQLWHFLQKAIAVTLRHPILRPTVSPGGSQTLNAEVSRMTLFKEKGFHVPIILDHDGTIIVMGDLGLQLCHALNQAESPHDRLALLTNAAKTLARLHSAGLVHGRPYLRDMTWDGEQLGFLDLEENPLTAMPLPTAQARDIWIFLSSASRHARRKGDKKTYEGTLIPTLYQEYARHAAPETLAELRRFVLFLRPLRKILDRPFFWNRIGHDARQAVYTNRCLESCFQTP